MRVSNTRPPPHPRPPGGSLVVDFVLGGLSYQIEHHLFPNLPRPNLRRVQPLGRAFCRQHYSAVALSTSWLRRGAAAPFPL
jgi:fatty acid desaturase